jgi:hypothetical protein
MFILSHAVDLTITLKLDECQFERLLACLCPPKPKVVGLGVTENPPTIRPEGVPMPSIKLLKKSALKKLAVPHKAGTPVPNYVLLDNEDGSFTIQGQYADGTAADISAVATLTPVPVSDAPAVLTVDPPVGMTDKCHALTAGTANVTAVATWTDGSVGPFTIVIPCTSGTGPVTGLAVSFGVPTIR